MHTLRPSREDDDGPRTVKLLAVSSVGRIVVYSELQPSDDRVKVIAWLHSVVYMCACVHIIACIWDAILSTTQSRSLMLQLLSVLCFHPPYIPHL